VADESKVCRSPIAGVVVRGSAQVGQTIQVNDVLLVLEAMKMETVITSPVAGKVAPKLKAAGARSVVLAGNPGANEAAWRAAGVDRFIFIKCDVLANLRELLREEEVLA